jgi:hypothetical protein
MVVAVSAAAVAGFSSHAARTIEQTETKSTDAAPQVVATRPPSSAFLQQIDPDLREPLRSCLRVGESSEPTYLRLPADVRRRLLVRSLMKCEDQTGFVLQRLRHEPDETRLWLVLEMQLLPHWRRQAEARTMLDALIAEDSNPAVVRAALETQRVFDAQRLRALLDARLAMRRWPRRCVTNRNDG